MQNCKDTLGCGGDAKIARETAGQDVCNFAARLAARSEELAEKLAIKLAPITSQSCPKECCKDAPVRDFPPFFEDLRARFFNISSALDIIEDIISRTDL